MRKPDFAYAKTKAQISFSVTAQLISVFAFATRIVYFLFYLYPKFQGSSLLLWLYTDLFGNPEDRFSRVAAQMYSPGVDINSMTCSEASISRRYSEMILTSY